MQQYNFNQLNSLEKETKGYKKAIFATSPRSPSTTILFCR